MPNYNVNMFQKLRHAFIVLNKISKIKMTFFFFCCTIRSNGTHKIFILISYNQHDKIYNKKYSQLSVKVNS